MRANGVIGSDYVYYTEKVGSVRKEVGFHGFIAMTVHYPFSSTRIFFHVIGVYPS